MLILVSMEIASKNRAYKRKLINQSVNFELSCLRKERLGTVYKSGEAINISSGGISLSTAYALKQGEILKLYLPAIARSATLPVLSEVVWVKQAGSNVMAGLRFLA
jgi:Tfp pilus assembly protein PilZ